jgi:lauroyl-KDO2-lipid IV(A) myristoyltransferase
MSEGRSRRIIDPALEAAAKAPFEARFLAPRFWPIWLALGLLWGLSFFPGLRAALSRWLGRRLQQGNPKRREIVQTNLDWCLPDLDEAGRAQVEEEFYRIMVRSMLDTGIFWLRGEKAVRRHLAIEGGEALIAAIEAGRSVEVVTCHTVSVDRGGLAIVIDHPLQSFANPVRNPLLDWLVGRGRVRFGGMVTSRTVGFRPVVRALKAGYPLYIIPDEDLGPEASVFAPFFGIPRATLTTPARLARLGKAEVYPGITLLDEQSGRYVFHVFPRLENFPSGDEVADATRLNAVIEQMVRTAPAQYLWSLRIFQTLPDGAPPPYTMKGKPGSGPRPRPEYEGES